MNETEAKLSERELSALISSISPASEEAEGRAFSRWQSIAKPLGGLGLFEELIVRIAGAQHTERVSLSEKSVIVMCADNGVVEEGVSQSGQENTAVVAENMCREMTSVCRMARRAGARVLPVDIGVARELRGERLIREKIRFGTANFTKGPAMAREECVRAILIGASLAKSEAERGVTLLATGEMGIGNTTTASAVASVLLSLPPKELTGRGAGLSSEGLKRKISAIERGIERNRPNRSDPVDVLSKVGGLDIAGLTGVFLGGAAAHVPVLIDGFISSVAALSAARLCENAGGYLLASHASGEPASKKVLSSLGLTPAIYANMHLGEGTGAVALMPLLDMALAVYEEMPTFEEISIAAYTPQK